MGGGLDPAYAVRNAGSSQQEHQGWTLESSPAGGARETKKARPLSIRLKERFAAIYRIRIMDSGQDQQPGKLDEPHPRSRRNNFRWHNRQS
jgi:hypothetical protein